jgi:hypothetical protein
MSSWGNNDNAANAPYWAVNSTIVNAADVKAAAAAPTAANVALLYANTQANAYTAGETIGLFGVDAQEASTSNRVHTGWVLRTTGSGGRAGRVQEEVLVAMSAFGADGVDGDAQTYANVSITLSGPSNGSVVANAEFANVVSFTVTPTLDGDTSATLTYQWQYNNADGSAGWANVPANTNPIQWSGKTSATLQARPATTANNGTVLRVVVTAADEGVNATSANAILTVA